MRNAVERKTIEESLLSEKERAQVTLNAIADAVIALTPKKYFISQPQRGANDGWPFHEAVGRPGERSGLLTQQRANRRRIRLRKPPMAQCRRDSSELRSYPARRT
jgi:hypothetical protein